MDASGIKNISASIGGVDNSKSNLSPKPTGAPGEFKGVLDQKTLDPAAPKALAQPKLEEQGIQFSGHAIERMRSRGISMGPERIEQLSKAVDKAAQKGSKETLVLMDDSALIVNVKNRTVVTAMDKTMMKENIFTNIDSTVVL